MSMLPSLFGDCTICSTCGVPCDPDLVSSAFYAVPVFPFFYLLSLILFVAAFSSHSCHGPNLNTL